MQGVETMLSTIGTVVLVAGQKGSETEPIIELEKLEHTLSDKALEIGKVRAFIAINEQFDELIGKWKNRYQFVRSSQKNCDNLPR